MEKQKLTLVYVDGAARVQMEKGESRPVYPEEIEPLIQSVSTEGDLTKQIFLDNRSFEDNENRENYNRRLRIWADHDYSTIACARINDDAKESIDFVLIEHIHTDINLHQTRALHVILVFGDGDYRSVISTLLTRGISVSLIMTTPNAVLYKSLSGRCEKCWALFKTNEEHEEHFLKLGETCGSLMDRGTYFQASYTPTPNELRALDGFLACSYLCETCGDTVLFAARAAHPCSRSKNAPPGLMTTPYRRLLATMLTERTPQQLFDWCAEQHQRQVEPDQLIKVFRSMEIIRWDVVSAIETLIFISTGAPPKTDTYGYHTMQYGALLHAGVIAWISDRYLATEKQTLLDGLREEVSSRIHHPQTARRFSLEGALTEEALRVQVVKKLSSTIPTKQRAQSNQTNDEIRDITLEAVLDPGLTPEKGRELRTQLDEKHFINQWVSRLEALMRCNPKGDILEMSERILEKNELATNRTIEIMVASGFLILDAKQETLRINPKHPFCEVPATCKEVA